MADFDVAYVREQGQDMIIVPLPPTFEYKPPAEQRQIIATLQACAQTAGLAGTVVPVWDGGGGRMSFIAPLPWHPFFTALDLKTVALSINKQLSCSV